MAHFSNGTQMMSYQRKYCYHCVHWRDNGSGSEGCEIMGVHFGYAPGSSGTVIEEILNMLIPMDGLYAGGCKLFWEAEDEE